MKFNTAVVTIDSDKRKKNESEFVKGFLLKGFPLDYKDPIRVQVFGLNGLITEWDLVPKNGVITTPPFKESIDIQYTEAFTFCFDKHKEVIITPEKVLGEVSEDFNNWRKTEDPYYKTKDGINVHKSGIFTDNIYKQ